ncbi:uncharacterized protein BDV14DRAFT_193683 [Aspergillus stella-maris]|uniref:uncharacterized protein n=1 Tax=Aspergillus stella-maris TaxID=1810926 RepID=UPI003CCC9447
MLIQDGRIAAIDEQCDNLPAPAGTEIVDVSGRIVSPNFVNTHVHILQTAYRSMGPNVTLSQYFGWVSHASPMAQAAFEPDDIYISALEGCLEGIHSGVTSYVEYAHNNWSEKAMEAGYRAAADYRDNFSMDDQWAAMERLMKTSQPLLLPGLSLDGQGTILKGDSTARDFIRDKAAKLNLQVLTLHHLGGPWPHTSTSPTALSSSKRMHEAGLPIILSHAPFLTESDQQALREHDLFVSITPESESHYGHGQATGHKISDQACLGLDTVWTFSGDTISQARLWLQLVRLRNYTMALDTGRLPNTNPMAGGRALRRNDIGVIRVGAKADLAVFSGDSPNMLGWSDPVAAVVLHANAGDIEHVLVDGEWRKRDFRLVNLPTPWVKVRRQFLEASERIQPQMASPPALPEKLWGVGEFGDVDNVTTIRKTSG